MTTEWLAKFEDKVLGEQFEGPESVKEALIALVRVARELEVLKAQKEKQSGPWKELLGEVESHYKEIMLPWLEMDTQLRELVLLQHEGTESVKVEGVGELTFPERWTYEVVDITKLERRFMAVDGVKVNAAIKMGMRKIKGLKIYQKRGLTVRKEKSDE